MESNIFIEFSSKIARDHGLELAIILAFFQNHYYLSSLHDDRIPSYPTVNFCVSFLSFWDEEKIRELIAQLYISKLI